MNIKLQNELKRIEIRLRNLAELNHPGLHIVNNKHKCNEKINWTTICSQFRINTGDIVIFEENNKWFYLILQSYPKKLIAKRITWNKKEKKFVLYNKKSLKFFLKSFKNRQGAFYELFKYIRYTKSLRNEIGRPIMFEFILPKEEYLFFIFDRAIH
jgi:hypothetical protein